MAKSKEKRDKSPLKLVRKENLITTPLGLCSLAAASTPALASGTHYRANAMTDSQYFTTNKKEKSLN